MTRKYEDIKHYIEEENDKGCKLETTKENYINTHQDLDLRCKCGNPFTTDFHRIKSKGKLFCNDCGFKIGADKTRKDGLVVYNDFVENNLIPQFKPKEYKNSKIKLPYVCNNHENKGIQYISYDNFNKDEVNCKYCNIDNNRKSKENIHKEIIENRGYIYIGTIYKNNLMYYQYKCPKHIDQGVQTISVSNFSSDQGCTPCGREKQGINKRVNISKVLRIFNERNYEYYIGNIYTRNISPLKYKCNKHPELGWQVTNYSNIKRAETCKKCVYEKVTGENHYFWKGGISPLHNYLRDKINIWKLDSLANYNFSCGLTGIKSKKLIVHHKYSYKNILDETLQELKLPIHNIINEYSQDEMISIESLLLEKHYKYGLGIPLIPEMHTLYHNINSKGNNTLEQFEEFCKRYRNFEFDDLLDDKYKYKNILLKEVG